MMSTASRQTARPGHAHVPGVLLRKGTAEDRALASHRPPPNWCGPKEDPAHRHPLPLSEFRGAGETRADEPGQYDPPVFTPTN